jgi:hypothetical protein
MPLLYPVPLTLTTSFSSRQARTSEQIPLSLRLLFHTASTITGIILTQPS